MGKKVEKQYMDIIARPSRVQPSEKRKERCTTITIRNSIKVFTTTYYSGVILCQRVSKRASHELIILIGLLSDRVPAFTQFFINLKISEPNNHYKILFGDCAL